jgi:hypothetical protein
MNFLAVDCDDGVKAFLKAIFHVLEGIGVEIRKSGRLSHVQFKVVEFGLQFSVGLGNSVHLVPVRSDDRSLLGSNLTLETAKRKKKGYSEQCQCEYLKKHQFGHSPYLIRLAFRPEIVGTASGSVICRFSLASPNFSSVGTLIIAPKFGVYIAVTVFSNCAGLVVGSFAVLLTNQRRQSRRNA